MTATSLTFCYSPDLVERFPDVTGGVIFAEGVTNGSPPVPLREAYRAEQEAVRARIGATPLSELLTLAAWRGAFRRFGVDPTQCRSAAEALLRRLTKKGDIPSINTLVDLGNLVSIRYGLPVAVFDTRTLAGSLTVRFADGSERYTPLGGGAVEHPTPGEVIFSDDTGLVFAERWCWRQSDESAARDDTTQAIITVEAQHAGGRADIEAALADLTALLAAYTGGVLQAGIVDRDAPQFAQAVELPAMGLGGTHDS
jgi:DNA/RNA-binding domain of Phe-tRNA-synthetase-like protein